MPQGFHDSEGGLNREGGIEEVGKKSMDCRSEEGARISVYSFHAVPKRLRSADRERSFNIILLAIDKLSIMMGYAKQGGVRAFHCVHVSASVRVYAVG